LLAHEIDPARAAEDVFAERLRVLEIILLHDPGRAQAATPEIILDVVLLEQLGERIAARIGAVTDGFGHGIGPLVEEMADAGVAADQDELLEGRALPARLEQPEKDPH